MPGGRLSHRDGAVPGGRLSHGHGAVPGGRLSHSPSFGPLLSDSVPCLFQWAFQPTNRVQVRFAQIQPDTFFPRWPSSEPKDHSQSSQVLFCAPLNWHKVRHGQPAHQPLCGHSIQFSECQATQAIVCAAVCICLSSGSFPCSPEVWGPWNWPPLANGISEDRFLGLPWWWWEGTVMFPSVFEYSLGKSVECAPLVVLTITRCGYSVSHKPGIRMPQWLGRGPVLIR